MNIVITLESVDALYELRDLLAALPAKADPDGTVDDLDMDMRSKNCLKAENIRSLRELCAWSAHDLMRTPNLGRKSIDAIRVALQKRGLHLQGERA